MKHWLVRLLLWSGMTLLGGCLVVGTRIPGTPVSVGVGVPFPIVGAVGASYRPLNLETTPAGAEVYINNNLVGSTPMLASIPFQAGFWSDAEGPAQLLFRKAGYQPLGLTIYASHGGISRTPGGNPMQVLQVELAHE